MLVTHLNDARGVRAIRSLAGATSPPREVVLADGGSRPEILALYEALRTELPVDIAIVHAPGTVSQSRQGAWRACKGRVIAFLDTDEVAPAAWLERLTAPLHADAADFSAGPTRALSASDRWERYHERLDAWYYRNFVSKNIAFAPMGNSAWKRTVFEALDKGDGHVFDVTLPRGGEDFDVNVRAIQAGFRGAFVPGAELLHDYSLVKGMKRVLSKKYQYALAEFRIRRRHPDYFRANTMPKPAERKPWHEVELFEPFVRRWARWRSRKMG